MRSLILFHCQKTQKNDEFYPVNWLVLTARHTNGIKSDVLSQNKFIVGPFKNGEKFLNMNEIACSQVIWKKNRFSYLDFRMFNVDIYPNDIVLDKSQKLLMPSV